MTRQIHQQRQTGCTGEIAGAHHRPVAQQFARGDFAVSPRHRQQVVASEQLGPGHHHQHQPKRKGDAAQHLPGGKTQAGIGAHDHKIERAQTDERARQHAEHQHRKQRQARLGNASGADARGNFLRGEGVETINV